MERLTKIVQEGPISRLLLLQGSANGINIFKDWRESREQKVFDALSRLSVYEDLEMLPKELIMALRELTALREKIALLQTTACEWCSKSGSAKDCVGCIFAAEVRKGQ